MQGLIIKLNDNKNKIEILEVEIDKDRELESIQQTVGGHFEIPYINKRLSENEILTIVNEEGKLLELEPTVILKKGNRIFDTLNGTVLFLSAYGEEMTSLSEEQKGIIKEEFKLSEYFVENGALLYSLELD